MFPMASCSSRRCPPAEQARQILGFLRIVSFSNFFRWISAYNRIRFYIFINRSGCTNNRVFSYFNAHSDVCSRANPSAFVNNNRCNEQSAFSIIRFGCVMPSVAEIRVLRDGHVLFKRYHRLIIANHVWTETTACLHLQIPWCPDFHRSVNFRIPRYLCTKKSQQKKSPITKQFCSERAKKKGRNGIPHRSTYLRFLFTCPIFCVAFINFCKVPLFFLP